MQLALLGTDSDVIRLARAAVSAGHSIQLVAGVRPQEAAELAAIAPGLTDSSDRWELALDRGTADAVIVGRETATDEVRAEQLKRLASEGMPVLVVHPAGESVLPYYEVDMARREMGGVVQHYNPMADHPVLERLAAWVRDGHPTIGPIYQVTCERRLAAPSRGNVLHWLARDVECLSVVAGDPQRVSAIGPKPDQASYASLQAQMTCKGPATLRWSVRTSDEPGSEAAMMLVGERGTITLLATDDAAGASSSPWTLTEAIGGERKSLSVEPWDAASFAIDRLGRAVAATSVSQRLEMSTWGAATHGMEIVDAIELSLEKGRTLDVHQQQLTDQLAFRGTMSALGCGLLMLGFFALLAVSLFGTAEGGERPLLFTSWPMILLALLAVFLLLQFAPLLVMKKPPQENRGE